MFAYINSVNPRNSGSSSTIIVSILEIRKTERSSNLPEVTQSAKLIQYGAIWLYRLVLFPIKQLPIASLSLSWGDEWQAHTYQAPESW